MNVGGIAKISFSGFVTQRKIYWWFCYTKYPKNHKAHQAVSV